MPNPYGFCLRVKINGFPWLRSSIGYLFNRGAGLEARLHQGVFALLVGLATDRPCVLQGLSTLGCSVPQVSTYTRWKPSSLLIGYFGRASIKDGLRISPNGLSDFAAFSNGFFALPCGQKCFMAPFGNLDTVPKITQVTDYSLRAIPCELL